MNALQCQLRQEIHATAQSRGFHFDKVIMGANTRSPVGFLLVQAWCGQLSAFLMLNFDATDPVNRNHFCDALCEQIISKDEVMTKGEIIDRREEGWLLHYLWGNGNPFYVPRANDPLHGLMA